MVSTDSSPPAEDSDHQTAPAAEQQFTAAAVAELQSRVTFQEDTLQALNQVIAEQDMKIAQLQRQIKLLNDKLNDLANSADQGAGSGEQEVPPHY